MPADSDSQRAKRRPDRRRHVLGKAIKEARLARRCRSQARLADVAGISERSVAGAESGEFVGRPTLAAIEVVFGWPTHKTTDYLEGDDDALAELPAQGPPIGQATTMQLADLGLKIDVVPEPTSLAWLSDLRASLSDEQFVQVVLQLTHRHPPKGSD